VRLIQGILLNITLLKSYPYSLAQTAIVANFFSTQTYKYSFARGKMFVIEIKT